MAVNLLSLPFIVAVAHNAVFNDKRICRITAEAVAGWWLASSVIVIILFGMSLTVPIRRAESRRTWIDALAIVTWLAALIWFQVALLPARP